jgi:hypothetical protein
MMTQAEKISAISQGWESIVVTGELSPVEAALSITMHRLMGSKEATTLVHRFGVGIPYSDVRYWNNKWAKSVTMEHKTMLPPGFITGRRVHVTFDNSDGKQHTLSGAHTIHHTTGTVFQARYPHDITSNILLTTDIIDKQKADYGSFKIPKKRTPHPSFPEFIDEYKN